MSLDAILIQLIERLRFWDINKVESGNSDSLYSQSIYILNVTMLRILKEGEPSFLSHLIKKSSFKM